MNKTPEEMIEETQSHLETYIPSGNVVDDYPYHMLSMWVAIGAILSRISNRLGGQ